MSNHNISVSFDRTVYPLDTLIHIRVRLNKIIEDELIKIKIYNRNEKLIVSRTINPLTAKNLEKPPGLLYQICVKMKGKEWKVRQSYILKAQYGDAEAEDSVLIDKRKPVLQTNKSVYMMGSDIIVTVIAPDLDRDNEKAEVIGHKPDHSLTISSSCGTLKNYKLLETGDSTGIFQGVIGLLPAYSFSKGKRKLNKPQGKGPFTGYIPAKIGDRLTFKFKSKSGIAKLVAFSSNFGATIELDQKVYSPTDKIYLTIVAPDFNYNSEKVDTIGNKSECQLTISTTKGKLRNYKLSETGKDTGIFTGEIVLTGSNDIFPTILKKRKKFGKTGGSGPINGKLACSSQDKLTITLTTESKAYQASAIIRFNLGEIVWDSDNYSKNSLAQVRVIDPDMNLDPNKEDSFSIRVWSDSDLSGLKVKVKETDTNTGIFEGTIFLGNRTIPNQNRLKVKEGDTVFAKYEDRTLPMSLAKNKSLEIISTTKIQEKKKTPSVVKILKGSSIPHQGEYLDKETITIKAGEKIQWVNKDTAAHTVTSGTPDGGPDGKFDSSLFVAGNSYEVAFNEKGVYPYLCLVHPWKIGKIIVK